MQLKKIKIVYILVYLKNNIQHIVMLMTYIITLKRIGY